MILISNKQHNCHDWIPIFVTLCLTLIWSLYKKAPKMVLLCPVSKSEKSFVISEHSLILMSYQPHDCHDWISLFATWCLTLIWRLYNKLQNMVLLCPPPKSEFFFFFISEDSLILMSYQQHDLVELPHLRPDVWHWYEVSTSKM